MFRQRYGVVFTFSLFGFFIYKRFLSFVVKYPLMKKIILCLLLLSPIFSMAQTDYVQMKNCGSLCFIPSEYSAKETPNLHILQSDGVGIYDNDISQVKNISLPLQEYIYQSSRTRNRSVEGVERTAIERLREVTDVYISYAASQDKDYATLSYEERQNLL